MNLQAMNSGPRFIGARESNLSLFKQSLVMFWTLSIFSRSEIILEFQDTGRWTGRLR
jgi:hypothetical protein